MREKPTLNLSIENWVKINLVLKSCGKDFWNFQLACKSFWVFFLENWKSQKSYFQGVEGISGLLTTCLKFPSSLKIFSSRLTILESFDVPFRNANFGFEMKEKNISNKKFQNLTKFFRQNFQAKDLFLFQKYWLIWKNFKSIITFSKGFQSKKNTLTSHHHLKIK